MMKHAMCGSVRISHRDTLDENLGLVELTAPSLSTSLQKHPTPFLPTPAEAACRFVRRFAHAEGA
jgi:hypothetical protein